MTWLSAALVVGLALAAASGDADTARSNAERTIDYARRHPRDRRAQARAVKARHYLWCLDDAEDAGLDHEEAHERCAPELE